MDLFALRNAELSVNVPPALKPGPEKACPVLILHNQGRESRPVVGVPGVVDVAKVHVRQYPRRDEQSWGSGTCQAVRGALTSTADWQLRHGPLIPPLGQKWAHGEGMDTNTMCEAAGCGSEMTELAADPYGRGDSVAPLAAAPIVRMCDEHARVIGDLYAGAVALALLNQQGQPVATKDLRVVADQLQGIKTNKAQATYALLGQHFRGIE